MDLWLSECFRQTCILEESVGEMARVDALVDAESPIGYGTEPDFVIAFALAYEVATAVKQLAANIAVELRHWTTRLRPSAIRKGSSRRMSTARDSPTRPGR